MELTMKNGKKTAVELRKELRDDGTEIEYICIDGQKLGVVGYTSERDRENAMNALKKALEGADSVYEALGKLVDVAQINDIGIEPDEEVTINDINYLISYNDRKAYNMAGEEIANCNELGEIGVPSEAIKALLTEKLKNITPVNGYYCYEDDYDGDYDGDNYVVNIGMI